VRVGPKQKPKVNLGSKDPLRPPSESPEYTLFSGTAISALRASSNETANTATRVKALNLPQAPVIKCGEAKSLVRWDHLHTQEQALIRANGPFAHALATLLANNPLAPLLHTNLHLEVWLRELSQFDTAEAADCYYGLSRGMELVPKHLVRPDTVTPNYFKKEHTEHVDFEIRRVLREKHLVPYKELRALFPDLPEQPSDTLGLGFVLKVKVCDSTGAVSYKRRLIIDASRPSKPVDNSVNFHIPEAATTLPTTARFAHHAHRNDYFAAADIADAFMNLGLKPHNWANVTIEINLDGTPTNLAYCRLAFGLRSAVRIFQGVAEFIRLILQRRCQDIRHQIRFDMSYIDDSACVAATARAAATWLRRWKALMKALGLPWCESKIVPPTRLIQLLGIMVCAKTLTMFVHESRVTNALTLMGQCERQKWLTLKQVQSIMGHLSFIAQVVRFARLFLRGLAIMVKEFNASLRNRGMRANPNFRLQLTHRVEVDFAIWRALLTSFNGVDVAAPTSYPPLHCSPAQCDASFWGSGYFIHGVYGSTTWSHDEIFDKNGDPKVSTAFVEAKGLLFLLQSLAKHWRGRFVRIQLDNHALVSMMTGERTKSEQVLPVIIECVALIVAYAIKPHFIAIGTDDMIYADPLSRLSAPKGERYAAQFKKRLGEFEHRHQTWIPPPAEAPACPAALDLPKIWHKLSKIKTTL
jgi:hypothetical protein